MQSGVVLHPSALPPAAPPPPLLFDAAAMAEAGGPGPVAAQYAQKHAVDVHPVRLTGQLGWAYWCSSGIVAGQLRRAWGAQLYMPIRQQMIVLGWHCYLMLAQPTHPCRPFPLLPQETVPAAVQFCDTSMAGELKATGDGASVCWLSPDHALLCLRSGQLLQLALLQQAAGGGARKVTVARAGAAPQPSCCCSLGDGGATARGGQPPALVFLGSAAGDSLLVHASPAIAASEATPAAVGTKRPADGGDSSLPTSKRLRLESFDAAVDATELERGGADVAGSAAGAAAQEGSAAAAAAAGGGSDSEDEEALIYGTALLAPTADAPAAPQQQLQRYQLKVLDSLANIGPVRDFVLADASAGEGAALL